MMMSTRILHEAALNPLIQVWENVDRFLIDDTNAVCSFAHTCSTANNIIKRAENRFAKSDLPSILRQQTMEPKIFLAARQPLGRPYGQPVQEWVQVKHCFLMLLSKKPEVQ